MGAYSRIYDKSVGRILYNLLKMAESITTINQKVAKELKNYKTITQAIEKNHGNQTEIPKNSQRNHENLGHFFTNDATMYNLKYWALYGHLLQY